MILLFQSIFTPIFSVAALDNFVKLVGQVMIVILFFSYRETEAQLIGDFNTCMAMTVTIYMTLEPMTLDLSSLGTGAKVMELANNGQKTRTWEVHCLDDLLLSQWCKLAFIYQESLLQLYPQVSLIAVTKRQSLF